MELTKEQRREEVERFEKIMSCVKRDGVDKLMEFIRKSDFYTAPASSRYHSNFEGGLLHHSLMVYDCLIEKYLQAMAAPGTWTEVLENVDQESLSVIALLHDVCKTYFYVASTRNQKTYDPEKVGKANSYQVKHDGMGDFIWETVPSYEIKDIVPYGHGEKSVMMIEEYMKLKSIERYCIR